MTLSSSTTLYHGRYSDGKSAAVTDVTIQLFPESLIIKSSDGDKDTGLDWPYHTLTSINGLSPGQPIQIGAGEAPESRLFFTDSTLAAVLAERAPHLSVGHRNRKTLLYSALTGLGIVAIAAFFWFSSFNLSHRIARHIPDSVRHSMGEQVIRLFASDNKKCRNPAGRAALDTIVNRLYAANTTQQKFTVEVASIGMVNAFATPGEHIILSRKLLGFVKTPEELAGVIAHEMGHGLKLHPEAGLVRSLGFTAAVQLMFGYNSNNLADIGSFLVQMKYSRTAETEADRVALDLLKKAKISKNRFADFFQRLEEKHSGKKKKAKEKEDDSSYYTGSLQALSSHPLSDKRIQMIKDTPDWESTQLLSEAQWKDLQNICQK